MKLNLSNREKAILYIAVLFVTFYVFWYGALNPLLKSIEKTGGEIRDLQNRLARTVNASAGAKGPRLYPREEQLSRVIKFIDDKTKLYGIEFVSLSQGQSDNLLAIDLKFNSDYYRFLAFINSLYELNTFVVIDKMEITQKKSGLAVEMRLLGGYI